MRANVIWRATRMSSELIPFPNNASGTTTKWEVNGVLITVYPRLVSFATLVNHSSILGLKSLQSYRIYWTFYMTTWIIIVTKHEHDLVPGGLKCRTDIRHETYRIESCIAVCALVGEWTFMREQLPIFLHDR